MNQQRMIKETISISDILVPRAFRTVESFEMRKAPSEVPVVFELKDAFRSELTFSVAWDGIIYAYALEGLGLAAFRDKYGFPSISLLKLTLSDWDDRFCLTAEYGDTKKTEKSFYVPSEQVLFLLERCRRIPAQMKKK